MALISTAVQKQYVEAIKHGQLPQDTIQQLRRRCQTDLFFLCGMLFVARMGDEAVLSERTHKPICDLFVHKEPDKKFADQDKCKRRLLLYPRGSFKSSIDVVDVVQWIICFPDIRVLVLTGEDSLATAFVDEIRNYFLIRNMEEPSLFQALFPEFSFDGNVKSVVTEEGKKRRTQTEAEFYSPARKRYSKEPTVFASSILSNNSGWHVDLMCVDDVVTDAIETVTAHRKIRTKFNLVRKLLMRYGYLSIIGTRYHIQDMYADIIDKAGIKENYGYHETETLKYLCLPVWWKKGTNYVPPTVEESKLEAEVELLFPEWLKWQDMRNEQHISPDTFASQMLNDPIEASDITFLLPDLHRATLLHTLFPTKGDVFMSIDLAYAKKKGRDFTVIVVGIIDDQSRLWVKQIIRGRYSPSELPQKIVCAIRDHNPKHVIIEEMNGAQWLTNDLNRFAAMMNVSLFGKIIWLTTGNQNTGSKENRISGLEPLLVSQRLMFAQNIECIDILYKEFIEFPDCEHDDIPDAISRLLPYLPRYVQLSQDEQQSKAWNDIKQRQIHDLIYQQGQYAPVDETAPEDDSPALTNPYLELGSIIPGLE